MKGVFYLSLMIIAEKFEAYCRVVGWHLLPQHVTYSSSALRLQLIWKHHKKSEQVTTLIIPHLKSVCLIACVHINHSKLHQREKKCSFLIYPPGVKGYKLWCLKLKKTVINTEVTFHEEKLLGILESSTKKSNPYDQRQLTKFQEEIIKNWKCD